MENLFKFAVSVFLLQVANALVIIKNSSTDGCTHSGAIQIVLRELNLLVQETEDICKWILFNEFQD